MRLPIKTNSTLDLSPPPRRKPGKGSFDFRERAVEKWLAALPAANLDEAGKTTLDALTQVNQLKMGQSARLRFLERVRPHVNDTVTALERQSLPRGFPQPERSHCARQLSNALLRELAIGYHTVIQNLSGSKRRQRGKRLALAIQRTIHTLGRLLISSNSRYQPPSKHLWQHLHTLYQIAELHGVAQRAVPDPLLRRVRRSSAADAYKQILLLAAAGPYRMRYNEIDDAYALFERWAPAVRLLHAGDDTGKATFFIDLESDRPPSCQRTDIRGSESARLLDTSALPELAASEKKRPRWWQFRRPRIQPSDPGLVQRLIIALGMPPMRQSIRLPTCASAQVLIGLPQIHRGLIASRGLNDLDAELDEPTFAGRDLKAEAPLSGDDVWDLIYPSDLLQKAMRDIPAPAASEDAHTTLEQDWRLVNASHGGYCLLSDPNQVTKAQINELVALRKYGDRHANWQIGVIRWMRHLPDGLQIGVRILGAEPSPALSQIREHGGQLGSPIRSLLLPASRTSERPATLLTSPLRHEAQQHVLLSHAGRKDEALLTQLVESCSGFAQFEYRIMERPAMKGPAPRSAGSLI